VIVANDDDDDDNCDDDNDGGDDKNNCRHAVRFFSAASRSLLSGHQTGLKDT
jgi:hypothetical protein